MAGTAGQRQQRGCCAASRPHHCRGNNRQQPQTPGNSPSITSRSAPFEAQRAEACNAPRQARAGKALSRQWPAARVMEQRARVEGRGAPCGRVRQLSATYAGDERVVLSTAGDSAAPATSRAPDSQAARQDSSSLSPECSAGGRARSRRQSNTLTVTFRRGVYSPGFRVVKTGWKDSRRAWSCFLWGVAAPLF